MNDVLPQLRELLIRTADSPKLTEKCRFMQKVLIFLMIKVYLFYQIILEISMCFFDWRMGMQLELKHLTKQFEEKMAVNDVSYTFSSGVYGLLGANGAGKTTLMRMICGILNPTNGSISFDNVDVSKIQYRTEVGYLPQDFGYYPGYTGKDFLLYLAALKGMDKKESKKRIQELLELVSLEDAAHKKIKTYSGGMKQRLGIAQALLNKPKLLILDEPTAGLDPEERARFRDFLGTIKRSAVVILSTHIVSDIDKIADCVLVLKDGKLIYHGKRENIIEDMEAFYMKCYR